MGRANVDPTTDPAADDDRPTGADKNPKAHSDPQDPTTADTFEIVAETGNAIPLAYGTVRVGLQILERYANTVGSQMTPWQGSHAYSVGDVRASNGNIYLCTVAGTSFPGQYTAASTTVVASGSGYAVNDTINLIGGIWTTQVVVLVTAISAGGHVTAASIQTAGQYSHLPIGAQGQDTTSGGGSGATFTIGWNPAGGPFSTLADILDGTAHWKFLYTAKTGIGTTPPWLPSTAYALNAVVASNGNLYYCTTAGTSSATGTVGNGPTAQSPDVTDGTVHWSFIQGGAIIPTVLAICEGTIYDLGQAWQDSQTLGQYSAIPHPGSQILLAKGDSSGLTRPSWLPTPDATLADVYAQTALLALTYLSSSQDASMPNLSLEVAGVFCDATHTDVSPCDVVIDVLTHSRRGIGWPSARVDAASTGAGTASSWRNYCTAYGLNLSLLLDSQGSVLDILALLLKATNTDCLTTNRADGTGMMLKFVPRADTALTANGVTFTPVSTATAIGPDDLLEPIRCTRRTPTDCLNSFPVEYVDRAQGYRRIAVDDPEQADVDKRGLLRASTTSLSGVVLAPASAKMLSSIFAQRSLNVRNTWTLKLSFKYMLLEPTDLLSVTDPVWGLVSYPMRIVAVDEQNAGDGTLTVTAEDWPAAVHVAPATVPQGAGLGTFVPLQQTPLATAVVQPINVQPQVITAKALTSSNFGNLWPNGTNEASPPAGANTDHPEWAGRLNVGTANAYSGEWVRQLSAALGAQQILGDTYIPGGASDIASNFSMLGIIFPAAPGEQWYAETQARFTQVTATTPCGVKLRFLDKDKKTLAGGSTNEIDKVYFSGTVPTAYGLASIEGANVGAPAGTAYVFLCLFADSTNGAVTAQFDSINVWRQMSAGGYGLNSITEEKFADQSVDTRVIADASVIASKLGPQPSWTAPTLLNSWANFGGTAVNAGYMKDNFGFVHLRGLVKSGVAQLVFTLPAGFRPSGDLFFPTEGNGAYARIKIDSSGNVSNDTGAGGTDLSLNVPPFDTR